MAAVEAARSGSSTERVRRYRARKKEESESVVEFTDEEAKQTGSALRVTWGLVVVPFTGGRIRPLNDDEESQLGRAFAPIVKKYLPILADWQYEITAAMVLIHVVKECYVGEPVEVETEPKHQRTGTDEAGPVGGTHAPGE